MAEIIEPFENPKYREQQKSPKVKPSIMSDIRSLEQGHSLPPVPAPAPQGVLTKLIQKLIGTPKTPVEQAMERAIVEAILANNRKELTDRIAALSIQSGTRLM